MCYPEDVSDAADLTRGFSAEGVLALDDEDKYFLYKNDTAVCKKGNDENEKPLLSIATSATQGAFIQCNGPSGSGKINWRATVRIAPWEEGADVETV